MRSIMTTCDWRECARSKSRTISMPGPRPGGIIGQQGRWPAEQHPRAEARQQQGVGAGDAAVEDVADDGDGDALQGVRVDRGRDRRSRWGGCEDGASGSEVGEDGAEIEQRLRGVLVHAVACIEHRAGRWCGRAAQGAPAGGMAEDDALGAERAQGEAGVFEGLAFFDGGALVGDEGGGGAEGLGGQLEARCGCGCSTHRRAARRGGRRGAGR